MHAAALAAKVSVVEVHILRPAISAPLYPSGVNQAPCLFEWYIRSAKAAGSGVGRKGTRG